MSWRIWSKLIFASCEGYFDRAYYWLRGEQNLPKSGTVMKARDWLGHVSPIEPALPPQRKHCLYHPLPLFIAAIIKRCDIRENIASVNCASHNIWSYSFNGLYIVSYGRLLGDVLVIVG